MVSKPLKRGIEPIVYKSREVREWIFKYSDVIGYHLKRRKYRKEQPIPCNVTWNI
uniref:Uncharacterized protein n=1 Tax=Anguilla anguilla TaxID=7936 RepID=A0A0E9PAQ4_ANGAN